MTATADGKLYYNWDDYNKDILGIKKHLLGKKVHLVSIYRGSLIMGTHLSNVLDDAPLTITKFQSYGNKDDKEFQMIMDAGIKDGEKIIILDDILDTGNTLGRAFNYFSFQYPNNKVSSITLFGKDTELDNKAMRPHDGSWIVFPWEVC